MNPELAIDINAWWDTQNFNGKELFKLDDTGNILLIARPNMAERTIGSVADENRDNVVKNLVEKFDAVLSRVSETEVDWLAQEDKLKMADKVEHLKDYLLHVNALGDLDKPMEVVLGWEKAISELTEEHYTEKLKLTEMAEALAESMDWKEAGNIFKDIADKYKQVGYVDRRRNDALWNRIEAARKAFQDRKRAHQDDTERDLMLALDLKIELAEQAEAMAMSENWKASTEAFLQIVEKWKTIGRTLPKKNEELWQRIMTAKNTFFDRKKEHYNKVQAEHETNYALKLALVERAEAMRESKDWNQTAKAYAELMDEWKKTGRTQHEKGEELWKRFTSAQEQFFDARREHTEKIRVEQENNFELKSALLRRAEQLKNSSRWGEVTAEMNQLLDDWKKIGPVPKEHNVSIWEAFLAARKHFFNRKDEGREQRKEHAIANRTARVEQAHSLVKKMKQEIIEEEEKLLDFNNALENITPGKKAEELRTHLDALISDARVKIKRLHEKLAAAEDELKTVDENERKQKQAESDKENQ